MIQSLQVPLFPLYCYNFLQGGFNGVFVDNSSGRGPGMSGYRAINR